MGGGPDPPVAVGLPDAGPGAPVAVRHLLETLASPGFQHRVYGIVDCGSLLWYLQNTTIIRILGTATTIPSCR